MSRSTRSISGLRRHQAKGYPTSFAVDRDIVFDYPHDLSMEMTYLNKFEVLDEDNQTNWILVTAPDAYLNGALIYGGQWVRNAGVIQEAKEMYAAIRDSLIAEDQSRRWSSGLATDTVILPVEVPI